MTLTYAEADAALEEIKYKPAWSFTLNRYVYGNGDVVSVWMTVTGIQDARGRISADIGVMFLTLTSNCVALSTFADREAFQRWVFEVVIHKAEEHEMGEWFTVNGERWYDPHVMKEKEEVTA